jgi:hypothetical protein
VGILLFQLGVAVYSGDFGACASILILAALAALRVGDVNQMNALKTVLGSRINGISAVVSAAEQKMAWCFGPGIEPLAKAQRKPHVSNIAVQNPAH